MVFHGREIPQQNTPENMGNTGGGPFNLVGGLEHGFYVSIYWEFHHPS